MRDAEFQLLVAACGVSVAGGVLEPRPNGIDWDCLLHLANRHRVQALCWEALKSQAQDMPRAVASALQEQGRGIVVANLRALAESKRLLHDFQGAGVKLLFLKGLTLAALAYRNPLSKMSVDIDLLIDAGQLLNAAELLRSAGYIVTVPAIADDRELVRWHAARKESLWYRSEDNVQVDLHTRLADQPALLAHTNVNSPSQEVAVASGVTLPTLAEEELFAYLCVHGASSAWFRLKWITDFSALVRATGAADMERLYLRSQELGAGRAAAQALLLAESIYAIGIGQQLRDRLAANRSNRNLVRMAQAQLLNPEEPTERFLGTATIHLSQLGLLPGLRFKLPEAVRQIRNLFYKGAQ